MLGNFFREGLTVMIVKDETNVGDCTSGEFSKPLKFKMDKVENCIKPDKML